MADRRIRWRPRFSLRTLAIVVTLSAVVVGWFTQSALRQRRAVAELTKLDVDVLYEHKGDPQSTSLYPKWLQDWLGVDFFAEATEVQFGFDWNWANRGYQPGKSISTVVLSESSRRASSRRGAFYLSQASSLKSIGADAVRQLRNLPHLRKLTIKAITSTQAKAVGPSFSQYSEPYDFELDPQAMQLLRDHPMLEELDLSSMPADDEVLAGLRGFRNLQRLSLGDISFSAHGAQHLATLSNLQELTFTRNHYGMLHSPTPAEFPWSDDFPTLANLRRLSIPGFVITDRSASAFSRFPQLEKLDCNSIEVDDDFPTLSNVHQLSTRGFVITDQSAHVLASFPRVQDLTYKSIEVGDEGIGLLSQLSQIRELNLVDSRITDAGAASLAKFAELRKLVLTNNPITDDGLRHLATLTKLETLYLPHLPITDAGLAHLRGATAMRVLLLPGTKITDAGLVHLSGMTNLSSLDLSFTAITDQSVDQLIQFKKLHYLRLLGTQMTRQQAGRLRQAFPASAIVFPDAADPPDTGK